MTRLRATVALVGMGVLLAACRRTKIEPPAPALPPPGITPAGATPSTLTALGPAIAAADLRVEARRGVLASPDPLLAAHRAALEKHFEGKVPYPLLFQVVSAGPGRSAVLLQATSGEARPLAFLLDAQGGLVWTKDHPIGGVKPGVSEPSLVSGPGGHVCLAWCNASAMSVALRRWAEDGGAFADYDAFHVDGCDALSALYWPHHGWLLVVAARGGATAQLVTENGAHAFGSDGMSLPWLWRAPAPVSLALDTEDSVLLFRLGQSGGAGTAEYLFASRWSVDGHPLWPGPVSLKRLPESVQDPKVRLVLDPGRDGAVRATLPASVAGAQAISVEVGSDGSITRL